MPVSESVGNWQTDKVCEWLGNDYAYYEAAKLFAFDGAETLKVYCKMWLNGEYPPVPTESALWVRRHLSDYDLDDVVSWSVVADYLLSE